MKHSFRSLLGTVLMGAMAFGQHMGQELRTTPFSTQKLEQQQIAMLRESSSRESTSESQAKDTPANPTAHKSGKKKWIIIGAVAGAVVVTGVLVGKRLSNEGVVIFR